MKEITSREDIELLVNRFYGKIRQHETLGPIFNSHITEDQWPEHLAKLSDFWETNLFGISKFKGSPVQKHIKVDRQLNAGITQVHFGNWLQLWFETIDELFTGEKADKAKRSARKMATGQFLAVWHSRS